MKIQGEKIFGVPTNSFAVSGSESGYTLNYSADGESFTAYEKATPANEVLVVNGVAKGMSFKLAGNTSDVYIQY